MRLSWSRFSTIKLRHSLFFWFFAFCCSYGEESVFSNKDVALDGSAWVTQEEGNPVTGKIIYQDGEFRSVFYVENGIITGDFLVYLDGKLMRRDIYSHGGMVKREAYTSDGIKGYTAEYDKLGNEVKTTEWNVRNGRINSEIESAEHCKDARQVVFYDSGYVKNLTFYSNGEITDSVTYYENGLPKERIMKLEEGFCKSTWTIRGELKEIEYYDSDWNLVSRPPKASK